VVGAISVSAAGLTEETVEVKGQGASLQAAVQNALVEAASQVNGVQIESSQVRTQLESVMAAGNNINALSGETFQSSIATATKGLIKRYEIVSYSTAASGAVDATVRALLSRYDVGAAASRKRIAVLPFRTGEGIFRVGEQAADPVRLAQQLRQLVTEHLAQSRRFAILDREFSPEIQGERNHLLAPNSNPEERTRLGRELGADYILAASLDEFRLTNDKGVFRASGREFERLGASAKFSYRIIELATGQSVVADHLRIPPGPAQAAGAKPDSTAQSDLLEWMADRVGSRITWTIYPVKVVSLTSSGEVILNQGGSALQVGDRLDVFNLGQRLTDPYTKEFIGNEELLAATLEITRVLPKSTYARVLSTNGPVTIGAVCRPAVGLESAGQPRTETTTLDRTKSEIDALFK
jgi:hypothetical protein